LLYKQQFKPKNSPKFHPHTHIIDMSVGYAISSSFPIVIFQQPSKAFFTLHDPGFISRIEIIRRIQDHIIFPLMIPFFMIMIDIFILRETGDRKGGGYLFGNLGIAYKTLGQEEKAIEYYKHALVIHREPGDRRGEGASLGNLGIAYYSLGQVEKAIEYYEKAMVIDREIGYKRGEIISLVNLGLAYSKLGQVEKVIEYYEKVLVIAREIGDRKNEGIWLVNLGNAYSDLGQIDKARQYLKQSLTIFEEIKSPNAEEVRELLAGLDDKN